MKKLRIYLDTSVISFLEAEDSPEKRKATTVFWESVKRGEFLVYLSGVVISEISECPEPKRSKLKEHIQEIRYEEIGLTEEIELIAEKYLEEKIIPMKYEDDSYHIASATALNCDVIVSWNFKHMVNLKTIHGISGVNRLMGYKEMEIVTPEMMNQEDEEDDQ